MRIGVMGAGAVGCYFGAKLAQAGHTVSLIGREPFVEAVKNGLVLEAGGRSNKIVVRAASDPRALSDAELVLFCVKSAATESAGASLVPWLSAQCPVLCMQNGVDNPQRLSAVLGRPAVPVAVYVAVEMSGPAHVKHLGRGDLIVGPFAGSDAVAQQFASAQIPTRVSDEVVTAQWQKLITNCAYNALSAITQMPYGQLVRVPGVPEAMRDAAAECVAVGCALGIPLPPLDMGPIMEIAVSMAGQLSSTAQDLARGKQTEIDYLNGYVVRQGAAHGIATPANRVLLALVRALESARGY